MWTRRNQVDEFDTELTSVPHLLLPRIGTPRGVGRAIMKRGSADPRSISRRRRAGGHCTLGMPFQGALTVGRQSHIPTATQLLTPYREAAVASKGEYGTGDSVNTPGLGCIRWAHQCRVWAEVSGRPRPYRGTDSSGAEQDNGCTPTRPHRGTPETLPPHWSGDPGLCHALAGSQPGLHGCGPRGLNTRTCRSPGLHCGGMFLCLPVGQRMSERAGA